MNILPDPGTVSALSWTLLHSLWLGAVAAVLLWLILRLLPPAQARLRYAAAMGSLLLLTVACGVTFFLNRSRVPGGAAALEKAPPTAAAALIPESPATAAGHAPENPASPALSAPPPSGRHQTAAPIGPAPGTPSARSIRGHAARPAWMPWITVLWSFGVLAGTLRLFGNWRTLARWRDRSESCADKAWIRKIILLRERLGLSRPVRLLVSAAAPVPVVIGWLKPAILVPAQLFTGLPAAQLEALLAHELAHIRRRDYLVNLVQSGIEILFFHHPAVWWISSRIRAEREHCCDDTAARLCGGPLPYARALAALEELRPDGASALCPAATGSPLAGRIRRILGAPSSPHSSPAPLWSAMPGVVALAAVLGGLPWLQAQDPPAVPPAAAAVAEKKETAGPKPPETSAPIPASLTPAAALDTVQAFLRAPSAGEKIHWLLPDAETRAAAETFFARHPDLAGALRGTLVPEYLSTGADGRVHLAMDLPALAKPHFFTVRPTDRGPRIDWLNGTFYLEPHFEDLQRDMPETPVKIPAILQPGDYYNKAFADQGQYRCWELRYPGVDRRFYGYEKRTPSNAGSGDTAAAAASGFKEPARRESTGVQMVEIQYPSRQKDPSQVEIVRIHPGPEASGFSFPAVRPLPETAPDKKPAGFPGSGPEFRPQIPGSGPVPVPPRGFRKMDFDDVSLVPSGISKPAPEITIRAAGAGSGEKLTGFRVLMGRMQPDGTAVWHLPLPMPPGGGEEFQLPRRFLSGSGGVRIEAAGRIPKCWLWQDREKIPDEITFELEPDPGISIRVSLPDGSPAARATVALTIPGRWAVIEKGRVWHADEPAPSRSPDAWSWPRFRTTDENGDFLLPGETDPAARVLITHDAGAAEISHASLAGDPRISLRPWGNIQGRLPLRTGAPGSQTAITLTARRAGPGTPVAAVQEESSPVDEDGAFIFEKILPGSVSLFRQRNGETGEAGKNAALTTPALVTEVKPGSNTVMMKEEEP
ncbi:MAG: M56 family metallopeptidase [Verrucomicrobiota bacterium]